MKHEPPPDAIREISQQCVAGRLRMLNRAVSKLYDDALRPFGLRISQMNILVAVAAAGPLRGVDVVRLLQLDASTLSRDLERMIDKGWIEALPGVGRAQRLQATAVGRALIERIVEPWREAQKQARALLTPEVADSLTDVVTGLWAKDDGQ
jgi:DNA-binding MarR family transcriptional regulator